MNWKKIAKLALIAVVGFSYFLIPLGGCVHVDEHDHDRDHHEHHDHDDHDHHDHDWR